MRDTDTTRGTPRDAAFTRSADEVPAPWHRPADRAAMFDRARGHALKARRHDAGRYDRAASKMTKAGHLVAMEVAWVDCLVWMLRALVTVLLLALTAPAAAQSDETLTLRSCISERGWRTDVDDCVIVVEVVRERVGRVGGSYADSLRALAPRLHDGCRVSRTWLCDLDVDCHRPDGWPRSASWERRREACEETVREVRAALASDVPVCVERPRHWGSREDVRRREAAGYRWRDAVCPGLVLLNRAGFLYRRIEETR